jgi:hypothetical protein
LRYAIWRAYPTRIPGMGICSKSPSVALAVPAAGCGNGRGNPCSSASGSQEVFSCPRGGVIIIQAHQPFAGRTGIEKSLISTRRAQSRGSCGAQCTVIDGQPSQGQASRWIMACSTPLTRLLVSMTQAPRPAIWRGLQA